MVILLVLLHSSTHNYYSWFQTFAMFWMLYAFFWVIPWRLNFTCWRFGTLYQFQLHRQVGMKYDWIWEKLEYLYRKRFGLKIAWANRKEGDRVGAVESTETGCGGREGDGAHVGVRSNYRVLGGCLLSFSLCRSGFQDLLRVSHTCLWRWNRQSVPKCQHTKFRHRGIAQ